MKNPFVEMKILAAAMAAAFRENTLRNLKLYSYEIPIRNRINGRRNPAGAKLIRQFYRAKFGAKADYQEAADWHRSEKP